MERYLHPIAVCRFLGGVIAICGVACINTCCSSGHNTQREDARKATISLLNSYLDALKELNAEKVTSHFLESPEFLYSMGGMSWNYDQMVAGMRQSLSSLKSYDGRLDTIHLSVLNPESVAAMVVFHYSEVDGNGTESRHKGEITWIAVRKASEWKFIYAHGFQQPDTDR